MDAAEFYEWVRETVNRGTTRDVVIPHYIRAAVREIENKRNWQALEWWAEFSLTTTDDPIISLPSELKQINFLRFNTADDGKRPKWEYVHRAKAELTISRTGEPKLYWQKGRKLLVLDAKMDENRDFELNAYRYTSFPDENAADGVSHWLVDAIPMGLHAKVMLGMAGDIRENDPKMIQLWQNNYAEAIRTLIEEDDMAKEAGIDPVMEYWPDWIPRSKAFEDTEDA